MQPKMIFRSLRGMKDIMPEQSITWEQFEEKARYWLRLHGYVNLRPPILEDTALFKRVIGDETDIVEKEMYSFKDNLNGESLTVRPEITAGIARAIIQHNLLYNNKYKRIYSIGPVFRHERPQRGRYRQFHQIDIEAFCFSEAEIDAEILIMVDGLWNMFNLTELITLQINTLGELNDRVTYKKKLISYFEKNIKFLNKEDCSRLYRSPMRILDSKDESIKEIIKNAPKLIDFLSNQSRSHFERVCYFLEKNSIKYEVNTSLVRGLDYYNSTVFEWVTKDLGSQGTVCGGGRYDKLIESLGGETTSAIGCAIGVERIIELLQLTNLKKSNKICDIYLLHDGEQDSIEQAFIISNKLRKIGLAVLCSIGKISLKIQFKQAKLNGAKLALVLNKDKINVDVHQLDSLERKLITVNVSNVDTMLKFDLKYNFLFEHEKII